MRMHRHSYQQHRLLAAHAGALDLALGGRVTVDGVGNAPDEESLAQRVEEPLPKLAHRQRPEDDLGGDDEDDGWNDAPGPALLVHEVAENEPHGLQGAQGEQHLKLRVIDGVELGNGVFDILPQVLVLEDERQIEEVEQQHEGRVEKRAPP